MNGANAHITAWPDVQAATDARGGWRFTCHGRELGHLHGDRVAHIPLPKFLWLELHGAGRIEEHPVFPGQAGWGARTLGSQDDIDDVVNVLQANYRRAVSRDERREQRTGRS